jgi:hypothetical protein
MTEAKKSQKSRRSRDTIRLLLALLPLPFALSLSLFPELGNLQLIPIALVFAFGLLIGTITHAYWLRALLAERAFYKTFYDKTALQPLKNDKEIHKKHTKILLPFYAMSIMVLFIVIFVFGIFDLSIHYLLPIMLGAMQGVPLSYWLMQKGVFS